LAPGGSISISVINGLLGMVEATIEDLAIKTRSLRESDAVRQRCCIEHDFAKALEIRASTGIEMLTLLGKFLTFRSEESNI